MGSRLEKLSIFKLRPAFLSCANYVDANKTSCQAPVDAFIKQQLQLANSGAFADRASRTWATCARDTPGKPSRKSAIVSPLSI